MEREDSGLVRIESGLAALRDFGAVFDRSASHVAELPLIPKSSAIADIAGLMLLPNS